MPIDVTPSTVATNALQAIPFSSLIGGPLDACIQAQALAAKTTWEFIQQVGLYEDPVTKEKKTVMVVFQYQKNGRMVNMVLPLISILPIPYIAINEITIDFLAKISAQSSSVSETTESTSYGGEASVAGSIWGFKLEFKANYSSKKDSKAASESKYSVEYTMSVHVAAGQDSMPAGLQAVLNMLQEGITSANPDGKLVLSTRTIELNGKDIVDRGPLDASAENELGIKQRDSITFDLPSNETNLKLVAIKGTPVGLPTDLKVELTPDEAGTAGVGVMMKQAASTGGAANVTVTTNLTINNQKQQKSETCNVKWVVV